MWWRNFTGVIKRAMLACENSGHDIFHDFADLSKIMEAGAASKPIKDYGLFLTLVLDRSKDKNTKQFEIFFMDGTIKNICI